MGSGKGGAPQQSAPTQTTSTVNQSNLPDYAQPYFTDLLNKAQSLSSQPYQAYTGDQIAPLTANQNQAINNTQNQVGSYQPFFNQASQNYQQAGSFDPSQVNNTYQANNFQTQSFTDPGVAQQYMNPYLQASLAPQIQLQNQQFGIQGRNLDSSSAANGAFGGYRNALEQSQNTLNNNLANQNLIGTAYNNAYNTAQNQFNTQQQQGLAASSLNNQNAQQQSQLGMAATGANNQYGLQAAQLGLSAGQAQQGLGAATQQAQQGDNAALLNAGTIQQNQQQNALNTQYQQFLNQTYAPYQQANWMSGILRGVPVTANQTVTGYQAPPSPVSQIAGLGLGAAGLSKVLGS